MLQKEIAAKIHASEIRADIDYPKMSSKIWEHVKSEQERAFLAGIDFSNRCAQNNKIMKRTICRHCNPNRETIIGVETHCSECGKELIHILNETHEFPYNDEMFSFEISEKYVPKVGDCVKISFKKTGYEYYGKIRQIEQKYILLKSAVNEIFRVVLNLSLYYDYRDMHFTQITTEELKAKYAEAGYDWDYETNEAKPLKWMPKNGDECWQLDIFYDPTSVIFDNKFEKLRLMAERGFLFQTKEKCQKFADHCLKYFDKK